MRRRCVVLLGLIVGTGLVGVPANAATPRGSYQWYLENNPPLFGPSVSQARDGSELELQGTGGIYVGRRTTSISGGGTYRLLNKNGDQIGSGDFELRSPGRYEDQGPNTEGPNAVLSLITDYRRGVMVAMADLGRLGIGKIVVYCDAGSQALEGFRLRLGRRNYSTIINGNTDFVKPDNSSLPGPL